MYFKWMLLLFYLAILGFLSLNPWLLPDPAQAVGSITWDLLDHAVAYGGLSILMMFVFRRQYRSWMMTISVILASSLTGVLLEYSQYWFTLNRQFSFFDAAANVCGSVLGVFLFWSVRGCCRRFLSNAAGVGWRSAKKLPADSR